MKADTGGGGSVGIPQFLFMNLWISSCSQKNRTAMLQCLAIYYYHIRIIRRLIQSPMKLIVPCALVIAVGFILAAGCVAVTNKNTVNVTTDASFAPFSTPSDPGLNATINATTNSTSTLKGSLRVSISGISYPANLSVVLDNETVGTVEPTKPLYLMVAEGDHTVMVCVRSVCEQENVKTRFGRYVNVDFSERLLKDVEFPNPTARPTARILNYYKNGNVVSVYVEFINPESVDHTISVDISVGYTYIDGRSHSKAGDSAQAKTTQFVKAGQKETQGVNIYLASSDTIMSFDNPVIVETKVK
jgi:hypothetical protein